MLCSKCSAPVTPVVAVDIDGTLGDYHGHLIEFAEGYLGQNYDMNFPDYDGTEQFRDWFCRAFRCDVTTFRQIKLAYRQGGSKRTMPAWTDAPGMVQMLVSKGVEVWLCTTRPYLRLDQVDPDTREWLRRNEIPYHGLLYDEDKYKKLAQYVGRDRVVAVLDDLREQYDAATVEFGPEVPILRRTHWNRGVDKPFQVFSCSEAHEMIMSRVHAWRAKYESTDTAGAVH